MQLPHTYSDRSFISCSYAFLWIYSQRSLSLLRRDWTHCRSLVCTGHVARESTHLWGGEEIKRFDCYFLCNAEVVIMTMRFTQKFLLFLTNIWIISLNFATEIQVCTQQQFKFLSALNPEFLFFRWKCLFFQMDTLFFYGYTWFHPYKKEPKIISMMSSRPNSTSKQKTGTSSK